MSRTLLIALTLAVLTGVLILPAAAPPAAFDDGDFRSGSFQVDALHSSVVFSILHAEVARFYGRFNSVSGAFVLDLHDPSLSSVTLEIDPSSVDTNAEGRDRHVRSEDFLHVEEHPELRFQSSAVSRVADDRLSVTGDLTVRGVTKQISAEVELVGAASTPFNDFRTGVEARFSIDRREFGMNELLGGLGAEISFIVSLEAVLQETDAEPEEG